jgi:hypothetical protein
MTMRQGWCLSAAVAALGAGMLISGCGGGSSTQSGQGGSARPTSTIAAPKSSKGNHARSRHRVTHRGHPSGGKRPGSLAEATKQAVQHLPPNKRAGVVRGVATNVFSVFGFSKPTLKVAPDGAGVEATVSSNDACSATADTERRIAARIRQAVSFVRSVQIVVGGSGVSLSDYVGRHCAGLGLPGGRGRVVLTQRAQPGAPLSATRAFTVHSSRWTVEYLSTQFLQVIPMKGRVPTRGIFVVRKRAAGRRIMSGAGTYRLRIIGTGAWTVRVRDGA